MVEDRASCGNYSPRFGSWFANTDLEEDGELAPRRRRDVAVAAPRASRGHPPLWYWMIWFTKCTDTYTCHQSFAILRFDKCCQGHEATTDTDTANAATARQVGKRDRRATG